MSNFRKRFYLGVVAALAISGGLGCGSASNNDQGTSFLAFGFFQDSTGATGQTGSIVPLSADISGITVALPNEVELAADGLYVTTSIGLENRMDTQFIRVVRIDCDYSVPGAEVAIPSDSFAYSTVLGPVATDTGTGGTDGGTGGTTSLGNRSFSEFFIVTADLYAFLNVNRERMPQLPFRMVASCSATGITQAGDVLTTNPLNYTVQFVDVSECCTASDTTDPGFQNGAGTGGDFTSFDETDTGSSADADSTSAP